jgi:hypothetical protein
MEVTVMPCPSHSCQYLMGVSTACLALAWLLWFPYAIRERRPPWLLVWLTMLLVAASVILVGLFMPYACRVCGGLP